MYKDRKDEKIKDRKRDFDGGRDNFRETENQPEKDIIFGRNSVTEAIKAERPLDSIMVARGERSGSIPKILADAKTAGIPIKEVDRKKLDFMCGHGNHQGIIALGAVKAYSSVEDIFNTAQERGEPPFIIICDEIEDPHNLGAIIRTAEAAGAHGVIVPKRRSASLSFTVSKTSAGAVEFMHVARVTNLPQTIEDLKKRGVEWLNIYAVDNVLQRIADPVFVGATILSGVNCGAKVICKNNPYEKVGVLCMDGDKPDIIEYYELTDEMANMRDENGDLVYSYGVIMNYLFRLSKLEEIEGKKIPVHIVEKKIECLCEDGVTRKPEKENGKKFEALAVDLIKLMGSVLPYEVLREKEFAPIKNKTGVDSVESARELLKLNGVEL